MADGTFIKGPFRSTKMWNYVIQALYNGIPTAKHWRGMKQHENCFTGKEAADWMTNYLKGDVNFGSITTREKAIILLSKFLESDVIIQVKGCASKEKFSDGRDLYRLCSHAPLLDVFSPNRPPLVPVAENVLRTPASIKKNKLKACSVRFNEEEDKSSNSRYISEFAEPAIWKDVVFDRLQQVYNRLNDICEGDRTIVPKTYINGEWVRQNVMNIGQQTKPNSNPVTKELPCWLLSAMQSLEKWPHMSESSCNLPNYAGVEIDVFKVVKDYFISMAVPILPCELYEPIVKLFIGSEFLDIANRSPTPSSNTEEETIIRRLSFQSVEDLMLDLSVKVATTQETNESYPLMGDKIYDSVHVPNDQVDTKFLKQITTPSITQSFELPDRSDYVNYNESVLYPFEASISRSKESFRNPYLHSINGRKRRVALVASTSSSVQSLELPDRSDYANYRESVLYPPEASISRSKEPFLLPDSHNERKGRVTLLSTTLSSVQSLELPDRSDYATYKESVLYPPAASISRSKESFLKLFPDFNNRRKRRATIGSTTPSSVQSLELPDRSDYATYKESLPYHPEGSINASNERFLKPDSDNERKGRVTPVSSTPSSVQSLELPDLSEYVNYKQSLINPPEASISRSKESFFKQFPDFNNRRKRRATLGSSTPSVVQSVNLSDPMDYANFKVFLPEDSIISRGKKSFHNPVRDFDKERRRRATLGTSTPTSVQSLKLPDFSDFANSKESCLYTDVKSVSGNKVSFHNSDSGNKENEGRTTLRSLKNKAKCSQQKLVPNKFLRSEELKNFPLPDNSCFETYFMSESPLTRVIPKKGANIHICRSKNSTVMKQPNSRSLSSKALLANIREMKEITLKKSLSESRFLSAENVVEYSKQNSLMYPKTLGSKARDSIRRNNHKCFNKRLARRSRRQSVIGNSTGELFYTPHLENKCSTVNANSKFDYNPLSVEELGTEKKRADSRFVGCPSLDDGFCSADSMFSTLSLNRDKRSPSVASTNASDLACSTTSVGNAKFGMTIGCLIHSLSSTCYHTPLSNFNDNKASYPGSKSTDILEESLDLSSKVSDTANTRDVSFTPMLPPREPVIVHNLTPHIAVNQLSNDYENVPPITKKLSSSTGNISDQFMDRTPYGVVPPYAKEGVLEYYRCTPSMKFLAHPPNDISFGAKACFSGLLTNAGKEFCSEAIQLILLLLEPTRRHKLQSLLKMMGNLAENKKIQLHPEMNNRTLMIKTFDRIIFSSGMEHTYDENLAVRITSFLMDSQENLFTPPTELLIKVCEHKKVFNLKRGISFCRQVSLKTYEKQKLTGLSTFLEQLLDQLIEDPNLTAKNRDKKLKEFRRLYPDIYSHRFPGEMDEKKSNKLKILSLAICTKMKTLRV